MYYVGMGKSQIRFTETFNVFRLRMIYDNMRRFPTSKIFFCRSLLFSNMQICYPRRKHKTIIIVLEWLLLGF